VARLYNKLRQSDYSEMLKGSEPFWYQLEANTSGDIMCVRDVAGWIRRRGRNDCCLQQGRAVAEFVRVVASRREMLFEQNSDLPDALKQALLKTALAECLLHAVADRFPLRLRHLRADAAVGHDFDVVVGMIDVEQHAAVAGGVPDAGLRKTSQARSRGL